MRRMIVVVCVAAAGVFAATSAATDRRTIFVHADAGWTNTGIVVTAGTSVTADGQAITISPVNPIVGRPSQWEGHSGPDGQPFTCSSFTDANGAHPCLLDGAPYGALVGMVGDQVFVIGSQGTVAAAGVLYLGVNDNQGFFFDNRGGYAVHVG
jgi:hypothetical protein